MEHSDQQDADQSLAAMRALLTESLRDLVRDAGANPHADRADSAIADFVDRWSAAMVAMLDAAAAQGAVSGARARTAVAQATTPDEVHAATLASLGLIVDAARAGIPDIDSACLELANTMATAVRSAIAGAQLRALVAVEEQVGAPLGRPN